MATHGIIGVHEYASEVRNRQAVEGVPAGSVRVLIMRRRGKELTGEVRQRRWLEFWGSMRMIAITFLFVGWGGYFYESCSGLTVATRRSLGQLSTAKSLRSTLDTAFGFTIVGLPLLVLSEIMRRQNR